MKNRADTKSKSKNRADAKSNLSKRILPKKLKEESMKVLSLLSQQIKHDIEIAELRLEKVKAVDLVYEEMEQVLTRILEKI